MCQRYVVLCSCINRNRVRDILGVKRQGTQKQGTVKSDQAQSIRVKKAKEAEPRKRKFEKVWTG